MKPLKLTLNAFGPFVTKQEIDFTLLSDEEIFLVTGETGAGKTTIFDGMSFALYGSASGDVRKPSTFKSDHAPAGELCWVEFTFALRGGKYHLRRSPAQRGIKRDGSFKDINPGAELTLPDGEIVTGATAVTERIEQILGLNHKQFKQTTMLAQGEFRQLIEANGKEKQQIFSKIFGTSIYSELTESLTREEAALQRAAMSIEERKARCIHELSGYGHTALSEPDAVFFPYSRVEAIVSDALSLHAARKAQLDEEIELLEAQKSKLDPQAAKSVNEKLDRLDELRQLSLDLDAKESEIADLEKRLALLKSAVELSGQEEIILATKAQSERYGEQITALEAKINELADKEQLLFAFIESPTPEILELETRLSAQKSQYEALYRDFLDGQAAVLAGGLADGEACPVCGSLHHPSPAPAVAGVTEKAVNDAKKSVSILEKQLDSMREKIKKAHWQAKNDCDKFTAQLDATKSHHASLLNQFEEQRAAFIERLDASGFSGYKGYRAALEASAEIPALSRLVEDYHRQRVVAAAQLGELERDTKDYSRNDVDALVAAFDEATLRLSALRESKTELYAVLQGSQKRLDELRGIDGENLENGRKYAIAHELATLARGSRTVSFERYILASYFDDIIQLANIYLQRMTGSRYRLRRREDPERGAGSGLDMEIIDSYTGKQRDISTLSGGESFKASLALALGLSGIVQIHSGGVSIDTMFIDEGFGSLDEKSLDSAVETLISLKKSGRMVGIISHVPQLRGYIPKKLAVRYSPTGSTVSWL